MIRAMLSVGVDVSSQPAGTAACWVRWEGGGATIDRVEHQLDDQRLTAVLTEPVAKIGLDVPLGWPDDFVDAVVRHHASRPFGDPPKGRLARRETDTWVHDRIKQMPLSVSTDRMAYPAMRMARLLGESLGEPVDRTGAGKVVEVYPAAALRVWGLPHRGYKGAAGRALLGEILSELRHRCPWLLAGDATWMEVRRSDHAFDALVCALVSRAHQRGLCHPIPLELRAAAAREGWIAVPVPGSLDSLGQGGADGPLAYARSDHGERG
jgi:predicted nuclease with RNAse H fold